MCFINNLYFQYMSFRGKNATGLELVPFSIDKRTEHWIFLHQWLQTLEGLTSRSLAGIGQLYSACPVWRIWYCTWKWCAVHVYSATTCVPEDLDSSVIWGAERCSKLLGGNTQHFLQVMEMFLCWGGETFCNCIWNWKIRQRPWQDCPHAKLLAFSIWLTSSMWGLTKSHPIICQPWIIISFNWLNWGARCKENDPH